MAGLDPAIEVYRCLPQNESKTWITGTSRVMTMSDNSPTDSNFKQQTYFRILATQFARVAPRTLSLREQKEQGMPDARRVRSRVRIGSKHTR